MFSMSTFSLSLSLSLSMVFILFGVLENRTPFNSQFAQFNPSFSSLDTIFDC